MNRIPSCSCRCCFWPSPAIFLRCPGRRRMLHPTVVSVFETTQEQCLAWGGEWFGLDELRSEPLTVHAGLLPPGGSAVLLDRRTNAGERGTPVSEGPVRVVLLPDPCACCLFDASVSCCSPICAGSRGACRSPMSRLVTESLRSGGISS